MPIPTDHLLAFVATAFVLIAVPGPSVLFVIAQSLTRGRRAGLATVLGNALGVYVQILAVAFGLGVVVERSIAVFTVVKFAGVAYLLFLGVQAFRHRRELPAMIGRPRDGGDGVARAMRDAFVVGIANPKAIVFFAAIQPQFVDRSAGHVPVQLLGLGGVFFGVALVSDGAWALAAGAARGWLERSPRRLELIGGVSGLAMICIGVRLAVSGRHD